MMMTCADGQRCSFVCECCAGGYVRQELVRMSLSFVFLACIFFSFIPHLSFFWGDMLCSMMMGLGLVQHAAWFGEAIYTKSVPAHAACRHLDLLLNSRRLFN